MGVQLITPHSQNQNSYSEKPIQLSQTKDDHTSSVPPNNTLTGLH